MDVDSATPDAPTFLYEPSADAGGFVMLIAKEQHPTIDGRMFTSGAIDWRDLPIPLTLNRKNTAEGQHKTAEGIGAVTEIWRDGDDIFGRGFFSSDEQGQSARKLIKEGTISVVSADVGGVESEELTELEADGLSNLPEGVRKLITKGTVIGVTALLHSSFNETKIAVEDNIIASAAGTWAPDAKLFQRPKLTGPTPLTIEGEHVFGHAAIFGTCHVGYKDRCVQPPRSASNYAYFNVGQVLTSDGVKRPVGRLTASTGHAAIELAAQPAKEHYDHTGFAAAYVAAGEDEFGIWFSGALAPDATPGQLANLRAAATSGDWRNISGKLEMVGLLAVNTPGFPVPRAETLTADSGPMAIIAAGVLFESEELGKGKGKGKGDCGCGCDGDCHEDDSEEEMNAAEDIEEMESDLVNWSNDLDQTFLVGVRNKFEELGELAEQALSVGTQLNLATQNYAGKLRLMAEQSVSLLNRSLGEREGESEDSNIAPDVAYSAQTEVVEEAVSEGLTVEKRLALLDADLILGL